MKWTQEKINELQQFYAEGKSAKEIANHFQVSVSSVKGTIFRNKISIDRRRPKYLSWDEQLVQRIEIMLQNAMSLSDIANELNISYSSLTSKMRRLRLFFTTNLEQYGYTPQMIMDAFYISKSQLRQLLNNKIIASNIRGRNLIISEQEIIRWLNSGYALVYRPKDTSSHWFDIWIKAIDQSLETNASMDEIADVFQKSKMSILYYMKKHNFPSVVRHIHSYNIYDRKQVNAWAAAHDFPLLPERMGDKYFELISQDRKSVV